MTPLRIFQAVYALTFGVTVIVFLVAEQYVRWPIAALGVLLTAFGGCLAMNAFGFATELGANAGRSRWTPPAFASLPVTRAIGVFFLIGGIAFAAQALLVDDL